MGVSITQQTFVFLGMALCGMCIGVLFDVFRVYRLLQRPKLLAVNISDLLFWILGGGVLYISLIYFNDGQLRWYVFVGLILGTILYFSLLSKLVIRIFVVISKIFMKILRFILKILLTPLLFLYKIVVIPLYRVISKISSGIQKSVCVLYERVRCTVKQKKKPVHIRPKQKTKTKKTTLLKLLVVGVLCTMVIKGIMQQPQITKNQQQIANLQDQISYEEKRMQEVDALKEKVNTDEYIEKVARERLGLVKENEKIFVDAADSGK